MQKLLRFVLFSNLFYCLCAVALAIETTFVFKLNDIPHLFWIILALSVFVFYSYAYWSSANNKGNIRSQWYWQHRAVFSKLILLSVGLLFLFGLVIILKAKRVPNLANLFWLLSIAACAVGYYGVYYKKKKYSLRRITILKPIVIGYVWSGVVVALPFVVNRMYSTFDFTNDIPISIYFVDNWLLISLLALLFDIKDFEEDENVALQTLVTKFGVEKTIMKIVKPGLFLFSCSYLILDYRYNLQSIVIALLVFCLTSISVALGVMRKQNIVYYLLLIDGLMLLKALIGITLALAH